MTLGDNTADASERILRTATGLFAALGYDGTSAQLIAEAAGVDIATLGRLVGSKRDLYLTVMQRAYETEHQALEAAVAEFTPDVAGLRLLVDRFLDTCVSHPEVPALWMHRWLSDAADMAQLEDLYVKPMFSMVARAVRTAARPGTDVEYSVLSVIWCVHGFIQSGVYDERGHRHGPESAKALARFRAHLHRQLERTLGLD